jgi:hypothetical protein
MTFLQYSNFAINNQMGVSIESLTLPLWKETRK